MILLTKLNEWFKHSVWRPYQNNIGTSALKKSNWIEFILFVQHITVQWNITDDIINKCIPSLAQQILTWTRSTKKKTLKRVHLLSIMDLMLKMVARQRPCLAHSVHTYNNDISLHKYSWIKSLDSAWTILFIKNTLHCCLKSSLVSGDLIHLGKLFHNLTPQNVQELLLWVLTAGMTKEQLLPWVP